MKMTTPISYLLPFIEEDAPFGDITSESLLDERPATAHILVKEDAVIAGLEEAMTLFTHFQVTVEKLVNDGDRVKAGTKLLKLSGNGKNILLVERTALNIIGRMSGIATKTAHYAEIIQSVNTKCKVAGTRKTAPGLRRLDKKAIILGGGEPHRFGLSDGILIKDNHLALAGLIEAIQKCKAAYRYRKVEAEVETPEDAVLAARAGADIVMLDNMGPNQIRETLSLMEKSGMRDQILLEISGGINESTLQEFAKLDIDLISVGALTHSVKNIDVSLEIT